MRLLKLGVVREEYIHFVLKKKKDVNLRGAEAKCHAPLNVINSPFALCREVGPL